MKHKHHIITSVSSGKGGVGKTFITINLAACLAQKQKKVLVVDCDLGLANIDIMLGVHPEFTLKDVVFEDKDIREVVIKTKGGFDFIPASSGVQEMAQLLYESVEKIKTTLARLLQDYDHIILDTGAGIAENVLQFNLFAHKNLIVLNRELTSLTDAYAIIKVIYQMFGKDSFNIIINSAKDEKEGAQIFNHINSISNKFLGFPLSYLGHIVYDETVPRSIMKQEVLVKSAPTSLPSANFQAIGNIMSGW